MESKLRVNCESFSLVSNTWSQLPNLPFGPGSTNAAIYNSEIWVCGNNDPKVAVYDYKRKHWQVV